MFPGGIFELLKQVVSSWEVIAVTLAFIISVFIINYAARVHHRRPKVKKAPVIKTKTKSKPEGGKKKSSSSQSNDELGLEEK